MQKLETFPSDSTEDDSEEAVLTRRDLKRVSIIEHFAFNVRLCIIVFFSCISQAGQTIIDEFFKKMRKVSSECDNDESLRQELALMVSELETNENPFIKNIVAPK